MMIELVYDRENSGVFWTQEELSFFNKITHKRQEMGADVSLETGRGEDGDPYAAIVFNADGRTVLHVARNPGGGYVTVGEGRAPSLWKSLEDLQDVFLAKLAVA